MSEFRHPFRIHVDCLKLDEKQKEALKEIENDVSKELIRKKVEEQIAEIELREFLEKETVDLKAVETKLKQIAAIKTEPQLIVIKCSENMKAKLTAKQREELKKIQTMERWIRPPFTGKVKRNDKTLPPPSMGERGE